MDGKAGRAIDGPVKEGKGEREEKRKGEEDGAATAPEAVCYSNINIYYYIFQRHKETKSTKIFTSLCVLCFFVSL
jgi:hypothetical protein